MNISLKKKENTSFPTKHGINFIRDNRKENNIHAIVGFVIFLICLGLFTYFGVIRLLQQENEAEAKYSQLKAQIQEMNDTMKDYDEVQSKYNDASGTFMNETELASTERGQIFSIVDQDIAVRIPPADIHITGADVEVTTGETTLDVVSGVLKILQSDSRVSYATVTTTAAGSTTDNDEVIADFKITYGEEKTDETKTLGANEKLTLQNAPFIADKSTRKFHTRNCPELKDVDDFNKVPFRTAKDAKAQGYVADDVCNPTDD